MAQRRTARRVPLSRETVVRAAVRLADEGDIKSFSMRHLAQELGVVPMALYKHVASKEDLLDGMIDVVFSEVEVPSGGTDWKRAMRQRATSMREALLRHRWAIGLMESRTSPGPANLQHHDAVLACLREGGFSFRMALHAYSAMDSYIYGSLLQQQSLPFETPEESVELVRTMPESFSEEYPYLAEVAAELGKRGYDYRKEFDFGLGLILDAIQRFNSRKRSPGRRP